MRGADWRAPETREDPCGHGSGSSKIIRRGSKLCHTCCCSRYRVAARTHNTIDSGTGHPGFRCAAGLAS